MSRLALATSRFALPGAHVALESHEDVDSPEIIAALATLGVEARLEIWDDPAVEWESYDVVVVRSTWGYAGVYEEFLTWARARANLVNPYEVIEYSTDKHYLGDLADQGFSVIETAFCEVGQTPQFPDGDFVVKPAVGAGSIDARRFGIAETSSALEHVASLHASGRCAVIQPYVTSIDEHGERGLIFFDGEFSHAVAKRAMLNVDPAVRDGDFRTRQMSSAVAEPAALDLARQLLTGRFADLAYARVDVVWTPQGWALMELELVEPALYLSYDHEAVQRCARALARRVN